MGRAPPRVLVRLHGTRSHPSGQLNLRNEPALMPGLYGRPIHPIGTRVHRGFSSHTTEKSVGSRTLMGLGFLATAALDRLSTFPRSRSANALCPRASRTVVAVSPSS